MIEGKVFNRLTVTKVLWKNKRGHVRVQCVCECGKEKEVYLHNLQAGHVGSCGCINFEHGMYESRPYSIWENMKQRCYNTKNPRYTCYGGAGIGMCDEWKESFSAFWDDMKEGYGDTLTLDRTNPKGQYVKDNCKWVEDKLQPRNKNKNPRNKSGVTGVGFYEGKWRAYWSELDGKLKSKSFSVNKYGEAAFELACNWRLLQIVRLNGNGAGYSEFHGK